MIFFIDGYWITELSIYFSVFGVSEITIGEHSVPVGNVKQEIHRVSLYVQYFCISEVTIMKHS